MSGKTVQFPDADESIEVKAADGAASSVLWWTHVPTLAGERVGVVGGFSATGETAALEVLKRSVAMLRERGCTIAVGPMDGNTWRKYRLISESSGAAPFFLEPTNPPEWPGWWCQAGFAPLAEYFSTATTDLDGHDERVESVRKRMDAAGVSIRAFDPNRFDEELRRIYDVSVVSFQENYLYTPISFGVFLGQYRAIQNLVRPELVLIASHLDKPVGYVFVTPDYAQAQSGGKIDTVIVKTLAVLPGRAYAGLGALLLDEVHRVARRLGFERAIHALMHASNKSRNLSAHYAQTIRKYTLYSQRLAP